MSTDELTGLCGGRWQIARRLMPPALVRALPARRRRKYIRAAVGARDYARAARLVGRPDPYPTGALFTAVDLLLTAGEDRELPALTPLAAGAGPLASAVYAGLSLHGAGGPEGAQAALGEAGRNPAFDPYERMCARAWALFLRLPRVSGAGGGQGPAILQYWDTPEPPADVIAAMAPWSGLAGGRYTRLDRAGARAFLAETFGPTEVRAFDACAHPAIESDFVRLAWLARHGGLYMDADAAMRTGFPALWPAFADRTVVWFYTHAAKGHFPNGILACPPGSALALAAMEETARRILADPQGHVYALGGPGMLTDTLLALAKRGTLEGTWALTTSTVRRRVMTQIQAAYKKDARSWHRWQQAKPWEQGATS